EANGHAGEGPVASRAPGPHHGHRMLRGGGMSEPVTGFTEPVRLEYEYTPGYAMSRFLRAMEEGRIVGQRCPRCRKVYVPPRSGACPRCGVPTGEEVPVPDTGTVTTFCIVNVPF